ncbi:MAG: hypothetical protein IRZ00_03950, partial [Gemmatimonadetes bacterium]|nr:hypothetical protein [Gemmatimonadota bacterium]
MAIAAYLYGSSRALRIGRALPLLLGAASGLFCPAVGATSAPPEPPRPAAVAAALDRELGVWREHWRELMGALLVFAAEAVLIGALLAERARRRAAARTLDERLEYERMLTLISTSFAHASDEALDGPIQATLGWLGQFLDVDAVSLEAPVTAGEAARAARTWTRPGVAVDAERLPALLAAGAAIDAVGPLPRSPFALRLPLELRGEVTGSLLLVRVSGRPPWAAERTRRLRLVLDLIASALARQRATQALAESEALSTAVLDSLPSEVAVLDEAGVIIRVNAAWRARVEREAEPGRAAATVGTTYIEACRAAAAAGDEEGAAVVAGLGAVLE